MRPKIEKLLLDVKKLERASGKSATESKSAADEASGGLTASYSSAGDAEHARNSANLSMQKHQGIKDLVRELSSAIKEQAPLRIVPVSFIKVQVGNDEKEVYLTNSPVFVNGYNLISPISPIGSALLDKKVEDLFLYKNGDTTFTGKVLEIG